MEKLWKQLSKKTIGAIHKLHRQDFEDFWSPPLCSGIDIWQSPLPTWLSTWFEYGPIQLFFFLCSVFCLYDSFLFCFDRFTSSETTDVHDSVENHRNRSTKCYNRSTLGDTNWWSAPLDHMVLTSVHIFINIGDSNRK